MKISISRWNRAGVVCFEIGWEVKRFTGLEVFGFRFLVFSFIIKPRRGARVVEWGTLLMC